ncbi:MAG: hypothetical protein CMI17_11035 [Opitutaceae bacterium]|nr:hypothetical protein [Opitutaceae bacterium]
MEPEERRRKIRKSVVASVATSSVLGLLTFFVMPKMKPAFYGLIWFGTFFLLWIWTMMATHY